MVDVFANLNDALKKRIVDSWKDMNETEKTHFINQMALAMSIWGSDLEGTQMVVKILEMMVDDGSNNLIDFGLYIEDLTKEKEFNRVEKVRRANAVVEGYRIKNALPSEPHKDITP